MSVYANELGFIKRTREFIEKHSKTENDKTFFLNCCVGLLIAPQQYTSRNQQQLSLGTVDIENWGIDISKCEVNTAMKGYSADSVENIARHFRNSICHTMTSRNSCSNMPILS